MNQEDLYTPHTALLEMFFSCVNLYEKIAPTWLRKRALDWIYAVIEFVSVLKYGRMGYIFS
jgi:lanosterol synthase